MFILYVLVCFAVPHAFFALIPQLRPLLSSPALTLFSVTDSLRPCQRVGFVQGQEHRRRCWCMFTLIGPLVLMRVRLTTGGGVEQSAAIVANCFREMSLHVQYCAGFGISKEQMEKTEEHQGKYWSFFPRRRYCCTRRQRTLTSVCNSLHGIHQVSYSSPTHLHSKSLHFSPFHFPLPLSLLRSLDSPCSYPL